MPPSMPCPNTFTTSSTDVKDRCHCAWRTDGRDEMQERRHAVDELPDEAGCGDLGAVVRCSDEDNLAERDLLRIETCPAGHATGDEPAATVHKDVEGERQIGRHPRQELLGIFLRADRHCRMVEREDPVAVDGPQRRDHRRQRLLGVAVEDAGECASTGTENAM